MGWRLLRNSAAADGDDDDFINDAITYPPPAAGADTVLRIGLGAGSSSADLGSPRNGLKLTLIWTDADGAPVDDAGTLDIEVAELVTLPDPIGRRAFRGEVETSVEQGYIYTFSGVASGELTVRVTNVSAVAATRYQIWVAGY